MTENNAAYHASGVVPLAHVNAAVRLLSGIARYAYSDWDKDAIWCGALETSEENGSAFEYRIKGEAVLDLTFRRQRTVRAVTTTVSGDDADLLARCQTVIDVLRDFDANQPFTGLQPIVSETFATNVYPGDDNLLSCSAAHFRFCDEWLCDECSKTFSVFAGRKWESVFTDGWKPLLNHTGITFLSGDAKFYFFPSYLATGLLDEALRAYYPEYGFNSYQTPLVEYGFSASQAQLVEVVKEITSMETHVFLDQDYV